MTERMNKIKGEEVLEALRMGLWMITLHPDTKEYELKGDERTYRSLGITETEDGKKCFQKWKEGIDPEYYRYVEEGIQEMILGNVTEIEYRWNSPKKGPYTFSWIGVKVLEKEDCLVLEGCHRILKDSLNSYGHKVSRKMGSLIKNDFYQAMLSGTSGYMEVDLESGMIQNSGGIWGKYAKIGKEIGIGFQEMKKIYIKNVVMEQDFDRYNQNMDLERVKERFKNGEKTWTFQLRRLMKDGSYRWMEVVTQVFQEKEKKHRYALFYIKDIDSHKKRHLEQEKAASMDALTNVMNRRKFEASVYRFAEESDIKGCALLLFDIDHFKTINDTRGHQEGDMVLKKFAVILLEAFRKSDYIGRFGGDEFIVFIKHMPRKILDQRLETICQLLKNTKMNGFTCSIGIYMIEEDAMDYGKFLKRADQALYVCKKKGRNQYRYWNDISVMNK